MKREIQLIHTKKKIAVASLDRAVVSDATRYTLHATRSAGFTLVETLLAVAILSMAVIAPLSIVSRGLSAATTGKDRFIATALAREAVEYVRNVRDTNRLTAGAAWLDEIATGTSSAQCDQPGGCVIDTLGANSSGDNKKILKAKTTGFDNTVLRIDDVTGLFSFTNNNGVGADNWTPSQFTRYVKVDEVTNNREARVTATVSWQAMFSIKEVVITDQLTNW